MFSSPIFRRKVTLIALATFFFLTLYTCITSTQLNALTTYLFSSRDGISCYHIKTNTLQDISQVAPPPGKSIFFHETSCNSYYNGKISITPRQACAVESAARLNPNFDVYLLFTSPGQFVFEDTESDRILQALRNYNNVKILHLDYEKYTKGTPVEDLYKNGLIDGSDYAHSHASDVLRYLTLWKFGGIYLDLDVIVIKTLENLAQNYAGSESEANVAAGVLSFSPEGVGHQLAKTCLNDLRDNFNGQAWGYNGPGVITRMLKKNCGVNKAKDMVDKECHGFKVFPTDAFYAVPWWNWTMYFDEKAAKDVMSLSENSYVIHVWNKHSVHSKININSRAPYLLYAKMYCPKVINECKEYF